MSTHTQAPAQVQTPKPTNAGLLAMRAANAARAAARAAQQAAGGPAPEAKAVAKRERKLAAAKRADRHADMAKQASVDARVMWRVSFGWREGAGDALTVTHVSVEAPNGAVRRAARAARKLAKAPGKDARFAGTLAVVREDAIALLA